MSLDVYLHAMRPVAVFEANITHNLIRMAEAAGLYKPLWRPDEIPVKTARELIPHLREGLAKLLDNREEMQQHNPSNGWGDYDGLVKFVRDYLAACEDNPDAEVSAWR